jgi:hypothetical protein
VGLEPTTTRLRALRSTNWARRAVVTFCRHSIIWRFRSTTKTNKRMKMKKQTSPKRETTNCHTTDNAWQFFSELFDSYRVCCFLSVLVYAINAFLPSLLTTVCLTRQRLLGERLRRRSNILPDFWSIDRETRWNSKGVFSLRNEVVIFFSFLTFLKLIHEI